MAIESWAGLVVYCGIRRSNTSLPLASELSLAYMLYLLWKKIHITSSNFRESPFFLLELQNRAKHIPQLLKPFILHPCPFIIGFEGGFVFFFFIYFDWIFKKS
jgi:hypothetical protein